MAISFLKTCQWFFHLLLGQVCPDIWKPSDLLDAAPWGISISFSPLLLWESKQVLYTPAPCPPKIQFTFPVAFSFLLDFRSVWNVSPFVQMLPVLHNWPKCYFLHEAFPDFPNWGHFSLLQVSWRPWTWAGPCGALLGTKTFLCALFLNYRITPSSSLTSLEFQRVDSNSANQGREEMQKQRRNNQEKLE